MNSDETAREPQDLRSRTKDFALRVIGLFSALPPTPVAQTLGKQLLRSGTSVGANYREADRSRSDAEIIAKFGDCLKEADETSYWLELIIEAKLFPEARITPLLNKNRELIAIFTTIIKKLKAKA